MPNLLEPKLLNKLEKEIRGINVLPMVSNISRKDVRMVVRGNIGPWFNLERLMYLESDKLEELLSFTPKLKCWYVPIFSINKLWQLTELPIWIETHPRVQYGGAFEFYYWKFFNRILDESPHLAPFILGISQEVNYLFTVLRDDGASVDSIVNHAFTGYFDLCLPNLARIFGKGIPTPTRLTKFLYGVDLTLIKIYR